MDTKDAFATLEAVEAAFAHGLSLDFRSNVLAYNSKDHGPVEVYLPPTGDLKPWVEAINEAIQECEEP
jgi:hypothetical protein